MHRPSHLFAPRFLYANSVFRPGLIRVGMIVGGENGPTRNWSRLATGGASSGRSTTTKHALTFELSTGE